MFTPPYGRCKIACQRGNPFETPKPLRVLIMSKETNKKSIVVAFRLSEEEFKPFADLLADSTMSKSDFFREVFLARNINITLERKASPEYGRLLFLMNKASNNINQIAKRINIDYKAGLVSESRYSKIINELISLNSLLKGIVDAGKN